jgi:FkbM family methyltransferase
MKKVIKKLYQKLPFKKQFFTFLRIFPIPKKIYQHLNFKGVISIRVEDNSFDMVHYGYELENEMFWKGIYNSWEKNTMNLWIKLSKKADVIFDIGANTGIFSLVSKAVNQESKVYGFEPIERICLKYKKNNEINNFDISCEVIALSNEDKIGLIYDVPDEMAYSCSLNENVLDPSLNPFGTEVQIRRLDTFIEEHNIPKIDLIKLDVETFEPQVLEGFGKYLKEFKPTFIMEVLNDEVAEKVHFFMKDIDYQFYYLDNNVQFPIKIDKIQAKHYLNTNFLICTRDIADYLNLN